MVGGVDGCAKVPPGSGGRHTRLGDRYSSIAASEDRRPNNALRSRHPGKVHHQRSIRVEISRRIYPVDMLQQDLSIKADLARHTLSDLRKEECDWGRSELSPHAQVTRFAEFNLKQPGAGPRTHLRALRNESSLSSETAWRV